MDIEQAQLSSLRPATLDDLSKIVAIEQDVNPTPWSAAALKTEIESGESQFWVLTDDETDTQVFAFVLFRVAHEQAHLLELAVDSRMQRQKLGTKVLRQCVRFVSSVGADSIYLEVRKNNESALQFYQHHGFVIVDMKQKYYSNGDDAYGMIFRIQGGPVSEAVLQSFNQSNDDGKVQ